MFPIYYTIQYKQLGSMQYELKQQRHTNDTLTQQRQEKVQQIQSLNNEIQILTAVITSVTEEK